MRCGACAGTGRMRVFLDESGPPPYGTATEACRECGGSGDVPTREVSGRYYAGGGVYVEFDYGFVGNTVLVTSDGLWDTNRIELEPEVWAKLLALREANDKRRRP